MAKISNLNIPEEAEYYLENDVTMAKAAEHFNMSKKTFQNHMKSLETIDLDLYNKVQEKKNNNLTTGAKKGGSISKHGKYSVPHFRSSSLNEAEVLALARYMVENKLTYRELEEETGIPKSTLQDNFSKERLGDYYKKVKENVDFNKMNTNKGLK